MPKLLFFVPCEQGLIDQSNNNLSVISVLQELRVSLPESTPSTAVGALHWVIASLWLRLPGDEGRRFEQHWEVVDPTGAPTQIKGRLEFSMEKPTHRNLVRVLGFPVGSPGQYTLRLLLSEGGKDREEVGSFPIFGTRVAKGEA